MSSTLRQVVGVIVFAAVASLWGCGLLRTHVVLLDADVEPGWVILDYSVNGCPPLEGGALGWIIRVHRDRYVCTSTAPDTRPRHLQVYKLDGLGNKTRLRNKKSYQNEGTVSFKYGKCDVVAFGFWFGTEKSDDLFVAIQAIKEKRRSCLGPDEADQ